jgi:hypothetical protein
MDELMKYVESQLNAGVSVNSIKSSLISQGYSPGIVDGVVESALSKKLYNMPSGSSNSKTSSKNFSHSKVVLPIISVIAILMLVVGGIILFGSVNKKQALLDVEALAEKNSLSSGDDLGFDLKIINMGSKERFDITLTYKIIDSKENLILTKSETIAISTTTSQRREITLPTTMRPGNYKLKVFATYDDKMASSMFSFDIVKKEEKIVESCSDGLKNQDEVGVDCGGICKGFWYDGSCHDEAKKIDEPSVIPKKASCSDGLKNQDEVGVDCGGICGGYWYDGSCHSISEKESLVVDRSSDDNSFASKLSEALSFAESDVSKAKNICAALEIESAKDKCYVSVAAKSMDSSVCKAVKDYGSKDECYYNFFMKGDYSVCEFLTLYDSRKNCESLRDITLAKSKVSEENYDEANKILSESESLNYFNE